MLNKFMAALSHDSTSNSTNSNAHGSSLLSSVRRQGGISSSSSTNPTSTPPKKPSRAAASLTVTQTLENRLRTSRLECEQLKIKLSTVQKDHEMLQHQKKENENLKVSLNRMQNSLSHMKRLQKTEEEFTKWINQLVVENKSLKSTVENLEGQLEKIREESKLERVHSLERFKRLESQNVDIISLNESSRTHYENFVQYIASHVVQGSIEQRGLQQETKRLTDRVTSLEEQCIYLRNRCNQFTPNPGLPPRNSQRRESSSPSSGRTFSPFIQSPSPREEVSVEHFRVADSRVYNVARRRAMKISGHPHYDVNNRTHRRKYSSRHHQVTLESGGTQFSHPCEQYPCSGVDEISPDSRVASHRNSCIHHQIPFTYTISPISSLTSTSSIASLQCSLPTNASSFDTSSSASSSTSYMNKLKMKRKLIPRYQNIVLQHSPKMGAPAQPAIASDSLLKHIYPPNNITSMEQCECPLGPECPATDHHLVVKQFDCKTPMASTPGDNPQTNVLPNKQRLTQTLPSHLNESDFATIDQGRTHTFQQVPYTPAFVRKSAEQMIDFHYPCPPLPSRTIHQNKDDGYSSMSCEGNCRIPNSSEVKHSPVDANHFERRNSHKVDREVSEKPQDSTFAARYVEEEKISSQDQCVGLVNSYKDLKRRYFHRRINHFSHRHCDAEILQDHYDSRLRRVKYHHLKENVFSDTELYVTGRFVITSSPDLSSLSSSVVSSKEDDQSGCSKKSVTDDSHTLMDPPTTQLPQVSSGVSYSSSHQVAKKEKVSMTCLTKSRIPIRCLKNKSQMKSQKWYAPRVNFDILQAIVVDSNSVTQSNEIVTTIIQDQGGATKHDNLTRKSTDSQPISSSGQSPRRVDSNCDIVNSDDLYIDDDFHSSNLYLASSEDPCTQDFPYTPYNSHSHFHKLADSQMYHLPIFLDDIECQCHPTEVSVKPKLSHVRNHSHPVDAFFLAERVL